MFYILIFYDFSMRAISRGAEHLLCSVPLSRAPNQSAELSSRTSNQLRKRTVCIFARA